MFVDALLTLVALWFAQQTASFVFSEPLLWGETNSIGTYWYLAPVFLVFWWLLAFFNDLYDVASASDRLATGMRITVTGIIGIGLYVGLSFLWTALPSTALFAYFWVMVLLTIGAWRCVYPPLSLTLVRPHRILVLGTGKRGQAIAKLLEQTTHVKYQMLGYTLDCHR